MPPKQSPRKENLIIKPIVVAGGINMDLIASTERMPRPGETVFATGLTRVAGGKGLNQAIAARRLGLAPVYMFGSVGNDPFGTELLDFMHEEDIETVGITSSPNPTGVALITVDSNAENTIVVAAGANSRFFPRYISDSLATLYRQCRRSPCPA